MSLPKRKQVSFSSGKSSSSHLSIDTYDGCLEGWESLVWYVVNRFIPRLPKTVSEEELYSAGMMGLWKASQSYDPSRGAEFKTYAYHRIRGAILDELRALDFLPRSMRDRAREEGVSAPAVVSLPTNDDGSETLVGEYAYEGVENSDLHLALLSEMGKLPEKMRLVMHLYYQEGMKMLDIAKDLGLTESRVSQIHSNAVARLRRSLRQAGGAETSS